MVRLAGVALSSIQTHLSGTVEPSLSFLVEPSLSFLIAAHVLRLREARLISADGSPTDGGTAVATGIKQKVRSGRLHGIGRILVRSRIGEVLGLGGFGFLDLSDASRASLCLAHQDQHVRRVETS